MGRDRTLARVRDYQHVHSLLDSAGAGPGRGPAQESQGSPVLRGRSAPRVGSQTSQKDAPWACAAPRAREACEWQSGREPRRGSSYQKLSGDPVRPPT